MTTELKPAKDLNALVALTVGNLEALREVIIDHADRRLRVHPNRRKYILTITLANVLGTTADKIQRAYRTITN